MQDKNTDAPLPDRVDEGPYVVVLGIAQDAGYPQAGCKKSCCTIPWGDPAKSRMVSCLGVVDPGSGKVWMIDATPDFPRQLHDLEKSGPGNDNRLAGVFLTHAHIGHYTGLMYLGREAMGTREMPVYAMPRMKSFLETNGPWKLLNELGNIDLFGLQSDSAVAISPGLRVVPVTVPHRDEFSETVGFRIAGPNKSLLYIPDIDKWKLWERDILTEIGSVDYALLDGTFYQNGEIEGRDMSEIPHPFIVESLAVFDELTVQQREKVFFIHFNHTNPVLLKNSAARKSVLNTGMRLCEEGQIFAL